MSNNFSYAYRHLGFQCAKVRLFSKFAKQRLQNLTKKIFHASNFEPQRWFIEFTMTFIEKNIYPRDKKSMPFFHGDISSRT